MFGILFPFSGKERRGAARDAAISPFFPQTIATFIILLVMAGMVVSCRGAGHVEQGREITAFREEIPFDGGKIVIEVDRTEMTTAERVSLTLEVSYPEDSTLTISPFEEKLDRFRLSESSMSGPELIGTSLLQEKHLYVLEPFLPGEYTIPAISCLIKDKDGGGEPATASTNPVSILVRSVIPEGEKRAEMSDITAPLAPPRSQTFLWLIPTLAVLVGAAVFFHRRRLSRKATEITPMPPPHVIALHSLTRLLAKDLVRKGEIKLFHMELSDILRRYLEARFHLRAPERTTEEFLHEIRNAAFFMPRSREQLAHFLNHCDLVKFAKHRPLDVEIDKIVNICRMLIEETSAGTENAPDSISRPNVRHDSGKPGP